MAQSLLLKVAGLFTNANLLSVAPEGALSVADNIVINKSSLAESRRGFSQLIYGLPSLSDRADRFFEYQKTLLMHYSTSKLGYYDPAAGVQAYSPSNITTGGFNNPDSALAKMKAAEANENLYLTSTAGILKLDAYNHTPTPAGMFPALDCTATLVSAETFQASSLSGNALTIVNHGLTTGTSGTFTTINKLPSPLSTSFTFTISSAAIELGDTYTDGAGSVFRVTTTTGTVTTVKMSGSNAPSTSSGTLTIATGFGAATLTYASYTNQAGTVYYLIAVDQNTVEFATSYANALAGTAITLSGGSGASVFTPTMTSNATSFLGNAQIGYRVVWGITDANNNLVQGAPSYQTIVVNGTGSNQNVSLQITIPSGITTSYFYQIYRSSQSSNSTTLPLDDGQLVYEGSPTTAQIAVLSLTIIDVVPDSLRGAALYTNSTQQGILQSNALPPYATDLAVFRNCLFFGNTQSAQLLQLSIISVGGNSGIQQGDTLTIGGNTFTAVGSTPVTNTNNFMLVTTGSVAQNINNTALNLVRTINQSSTNTNIYAYYISSVGALPGQILLQNRSQGGAVFYVTSSNGSTAYSPVLPTSGTSVFSTSTTNLNGLMYSKQQTPDAVPSVNILYPGSAAKKILRLIALRSSLFILKEDGIYRCTGNDPSTFVIDLIDNTALLIAPESAVALDNQIYALTTQGVVAISDTGVQIISDYIQDQIINISTVAPTETANYSFGVAYESERQYILWMPSEVGDTSANQAFVYNYLTKAWTRWTRTQQHGIVLSADNKIYLADPSSSYINQERKDGIYSDYSDEAVACTITSASGLTIGLATVVNATPGDLLYVSIAESSIITSVNVGANTVTVTDFVTWNLPGSFTSSGVNTSTGAITVTAHGYAVGQLVTLTTTGTLPTGLAVSTSYYVIVVDTNTIKLATSLANANAGTYITLTGAGSGSSKVVPTSYILKSIACEFEWIPNAAQNAGLLKHWTEATLLLRQDFFDTATLNFYTDVDGAVEGVTFPGSTTGGWGQFLWGSIPWGESARSLPFRTYVPRNKQRADLLSVQFVCQNTWARFAVEGISYVVRGVSPRVGN